MKLFRKPNGDHCQLLDLLSLSARVWAFGGGGGGGGQVALNLKDRGLRRVQCSMLYVQNQPVDMGL